MSLSHYSKEPLAAIEPTYTYGYEPINGMKPRGFWVSVDGDDDWANWCQGESFGLDRYKFQQPVTLLGNNVLHLTSKEAVLDFARRYPGITKHPELSAYMARNSIDWKRVQQDYDGIIIAPYQWSLRLGENMLWYYSWDCASGCIWNTSIIRLGPATPINWELPEEVTQED